jgi:hypothetical protein
MHQDLKLQLATTKALFKYGIWSVTPKCQKCLDITRESVHYHGQEIFSLADPGIEA